MARRRRTRIKTPMKTVTIPKQITLSNNQNTSAEVTLRDAQECLKKTVSYLEAHPDLARNYIEMILELLHLLNDQQTPQDDVKSIVDDGEQFIKDIKPLADDDKELVKDLKPFVDSSGPPHGDDIQPFVEDVKSFEHVDDIPRNHTENNSETSHSACGEDVGMVKHRINYSADDDDSDTNLDSYEADISLSMKDQETLNNPTSSEHVALVDTMEKVPQTTAKDGGVYTCYMCDRSYKFLGHLKGHMKNVHAGHAAETPYKCTTCDVGFECLWGIEQHVLEMHKPCIATTHGEDRMRKHHTQCVESSDMKSTGPENDADNNAVSTLGQTVNTEGKHNLDYQQDEGNLLNSHERSTDSEVFSDTEMEASNTCCLCEKSYSYTECLKKHMSKLHGFKAPYKCMSCEKELISFDSFNRHVHQHKAGSECDICKERFTDLRQLDLHMRKHKDPKPYKCHICNKEFSRREQASKHAILHTGVRKFGCDTCGKRFAYRCGLRAHTLTHADERRYMCSICGKGFVSAPNFKIHMRTHTGEKPYVCSVCNRGFSEASKLRMHFRQHTGERPFICSVCGATFINSSALRLHNMLHTGEKPHQCATCGKHFRRLYTLKVHQKTHNLY